MEDFWDGFKAVVAVVLAIILVIGGWMVIYPNYRVWAAGQAGKAELAQADYNKQIMVVQAKAQQDAAEFQKQAQITRAEGIAAANKIIGLSLSPEYVQWLFVDGLNEGLNKNQIIYMPTAGLVPTFDFTTHPPLTTANLSR